MYTYKVKATVRKSVDNYDLINTKLESVLKKSELIDIGNSEYGTNSYEKGMAVILFLGKSDWFLNNASELKWFNGEDYEQLNDYCEEDSLSYYLSKRV